MTFPQRHRITLGLVLVTTITLFANTHRPALAQNRNPDTDRVRFSFSKAPWRSVIQWLATSGDYALHVSDLPLGSLTYFDDRQYTHDEAINRINMFLIPQRYTLVRSEKLLSVISLVDENSLRQLDTIAKPVAVDDLTDLGSHEFAKCLFPLGDIAAEHAIQELDSLMLVREPAVLPNTNQLMVMDTAEKLRTVAQVLAALAKPDPAAGPIRRFPLGSLDPEQALVQIRPHVGLDPLAMTGADVRLSIDKERHQLLASGSNENLQAVANVISLLQETEIPVHQQEEMVFRTHDVGEAELQTVVNVLQTLLAEEDVRQAANPRSNQLAALATERVHRMIEETIRELTGTADTLEFRAIDVPGVNARYAAIVLNDMFASQQVASDEEPAPDESLRIDADAAAGRLFIRARKSQLEQIERALEQFTNPAGTIGPKLRVLPYHGKKAKALLDTARRFWPHDDSLEIVPAPNDDSDAKPLEREIDSQQLRKSESSHETPSSRDVTLPTKNRNRGQQFDPLFSDVESADESGRDSAAVLVATGYPADLRPSNSIDELSTADDAARIRIQLTPSGMLIHSEDPGALERFEEHLKLITGATPQADRRLAVFYLKHAKVDDANTLLRQLLFEDSMSAKGSSAGLARFSLPPNDFDVANDLDSSWIYDSATVIPDKRLNRFFAYGSDENLTTIENHLQVIDRENSIARLNTHGTPRMITLFHAKADAVAMVIRDAYSGRIASTTQERTAAAAARAQNQQRQNPAARQDPGSAANGSPSPNAVATGDENKMTLAVDAQSNSLIVTAPSQLAEEVEALALAIDKEGQQFVDIIPLSGQRTLRIQESLQSLFGDRIRIGKPNERSTSKSQQ